MLVRSAYGIANRHRFHEAVDVIVYIEGGPPQTEIAEVSSGYDIVFWQNLFARYLPQTKVRFISVGSKSVVLSYLDKIAEANTRTALCAIDRDIDIYLDCQRRDPRLLRTFGYSWENDIWNQHNFLSTLCFLTHTQALPQTIHDEASEAYAYFCSKLWYAIRTDIILQLNGHRLFEKNCVGGGIIYFNNGHVLINKDKLRLAIRKKRTLFHTLRVRTLPHHTHPTIDCYGHMFSFYFQKTIQRLARLACRNCPQDRNIIDVAILKFISSFDYADNAAIHAHYTTTFSSVEVFITAT